MDPIYRIIGLTVLIVLMCWAISKVAAQGQKPEVGKKLMDKLLFWCLFVPVIGTTVGTLILFWLKNHHLI